MSVTGIAIGVQAPQFGSVVGAETPGTDGFLLPNQPNIVDFLEFLNTSVQIPPEALPPSSPWPQYALNQSMLLTLVLGAGIAYTLAVYNGATHILFSITPDQRGQNYFLDKRGNGPDGFNLIQPSTGLVASTSDEGTSVSVATPDWAHRMMVDDLDFYKTPWGRKYLSWQQKYGKNVVGLT